MLLSNLRVGIIGGSISGQLNAYYLIQLGANVTIYERSNTDSFIDRGVGIGVPTHIINKLTSEGILSSDMKYLHCSFFNRIVPNKITHTEYGNILWKQPIQVELLSWSELFHQLSYHIPKNIIQFDKKVVSVEMNADHKPTIEFADGSRQEFDLVIGSDGYQSTVRKYISPESNLQYAGYVLWRGFLTESELQNFTADPSVFDEFAFVFLPEVGGHLVMYYVIKADGQKVLTWGLYIVLDRDEFDVAMTDKNGCKHSYTVPAGCVNVAIEEKWKHMAMKELPDVFGAVIAATSNTFIQGIFDMDLPSLTRGKVVLTGDAGFVARPHTVAGFAKAYENATALLAALTESTSIEEALQKYDSSQIATMHQAIVLGRNLGDGTVLNIPCEIKEWNDEQCKEWLGSLINVSGKLNIYSK